MDPRDRWTRHAARSTLGAAFFSRDARQVAPDLLGQRLVSTVSGKRVEVVIVEVEAYLGPEDPASHAATRSGRTDRNRVMFGPSGRAYVYRSYGIHWCLNVVTGPDGEAQAVLIRGIEPLEGLDTVVRRRGGRRPLGAGPGRVGQVLAVDLSLYAHDLRTAPLRIEPGWRVPESEIVRSGRIGIRSAVDWPLRFFVDGSPGVTRTRAPEGTAGEGDMPPLSSALPAGLGPP